MSEKHSIRHIGLPVALGDPSSPQRFYIGCKGAFSSGEWAAAVWRNVEFYETRSLAEFACDEMHAQGEPSEAIVRITSQGRQFRAHSHRQALAVTEPERGYDFGSW